MFQVALVTVVILLTATLTKVIRDRYLSSNSVRHEHHRNLAAWTDIFIRERLEAWT